jgi:hypothetical protein
MFLFIQLFWCFECEISSQELLTFNHVYKISMLMFSMYLCQQNFCVDVSNVSMLTSVFFTGEISPEGEFFLPLPYFWRNLDPKKTFL